jgi:hypothetical protein
MLSCFYFEEGGSPPPTYLEGLVALVLYLEGESGLVWPPEDLRLLLLLLPGEAALVRPPEDLRLLLLLPGGGGCSCPSS